MKKLLTLGMLLLITTPLTFSMEKANQLSDAINENNIEEVAKLLDEGADIYFEVGTIDTTPLWSVAVANGNVDIIKLFFDHGFDVNRTTAAGNNTPLGQACAQGNLALVQLFLDLGAEINAVDGSGISALDAAIVFDYLDIVKLLLSRGADVNHSGVQGMTPLMRAVYQEPTVFNSVRLLLDAGADINAKDNDGKTALHLAAISENFDAALELLAYVPFQKNELRTGLRGSLLLLRDTKQQLPPEIVMELSRILIDELVQKQMKSAQALLDVKDNQGMTALDYAKQGNNTELVKLLDLNNPESKKIIRAKIIKNLLGDFSEMIRTILPYEMLFELEQAEQAKTE